MAHKGIGMISYTIPVNSLNGEHEGKPDRYTCIVCRCASVESPSVELQHADGCPIADLAAALTKLREIAEGSAWQNPQQAAQRFLDELR